MAQKASPSIKGQSLEKPPLNIEGQKPETIPSVAKKLSQALKVENLKSIYS